jgi:hypothetical protein
VSSTLKTSNIKMQKTGAGGIVSMRRPLPASDLERYPLTKETMFTLDQLVPWGPSYEKYSAMVALAGAEIAGRILGCGDGPASFNAEATRGANKVVLSDPIYVFCTADIETRIAIIDGQVIDSAG